jgi:hypothetical protein
MVGWLDKADIDTAYVAPGKAWQNPTNGPHDGGRARPLLDVDLE